MTPLPPGEELIERAKLSREEMTYIADRDITAVVVALACKRADEVIEALTAALTAIEPELNRLRGEVERKDEALRECQLYIFQHATSQSARAIAAKVDDALKGKEAK